MSRRCFKYLSTKESPGTSALFLNLSAQAETKRSYGLRTNENRSVRESIAVRYKVDRQTREGDFKPEYLRL
jgi:hypothetical protein